MKQLREHIKKEIKKLMEDKMRSYPIPSNIRNALEKNLHLVPLVRYVSTLKAAATVPPSYRVFFINNQYIDLYMEQIGIRAEINHKSFWLHDVREANAAKEELNNNVLTQPIPIASDEEGEEESEEGEEETEMEPETGEEETPEEA